MTIMPIDNAVVFALLLYALCYFIGENHWINERNEKLQKRIDKLKQELYDSRNSSDDEPNHWADNRFAD